MFIQMFLTFPFFNEMKYPVSKDIGNQFIPDASRLVPDYWDDVLDYPDKIPVPVRHNGTSRINKYHTYYALLLIKSLVRFSGSVPFLGNNRYSMSSLQ
jgi:hypothetical protein